MMMMMMIPRLFHCNHNFQPPQCVQGVWFNGYEIHPVVIDGEGVRRLLKACSSPRQKLHFANLSGSRK
jgi:hypothetical protein